MKQTPQQRMVRDAINQLLFIADYGTEPQRVSLVAHWLPELLAARNANDATEQTRAGREAFTAMRAAFALCIRPNTPSTTALQPSESPIS